MKVSGTAPLRRLLHTALMALCTGCVLGTVQADSENKANREQLDIFFPSTIRPYQLQLKIGALFPDINVMVFGSYLDFEHNIKKDHPNAIITFPFVVEQLDDYKIVLAGVRNGDSTEPWVLLTTTPDLSIQSVHQFTLGSIDYLGSNGMNKFLKSMFNPPPSLQRVPNLVDLPVLLTFNMAQALLCTQNNAAQITKKTTITYSRIAVPNSRTALVSVAVSNTGTASKTIAAVKHSKELLQILTITDWSVR